LKAGFSVVYSGTQGDLGPYSYWVQGIEKDLETWSFIAIFDSIQFHEAGYCAFTSALDRVKVAGWLLGKMKTIWLSVDIQ